MVARQKIHAGMIHAGKTATVICENNHFRVVIDGETAAVVPRTTTSEVHRYKANATDKRTQPGLPRKDGDSHARSEAGRRRRGRARRAAAVPQPMAGPRPRPPGRLPGSSSSATPPTAWPSCAATWSGSPSCSAAATARPCSAPTRHSEVPVTVTSPLRGPENPEGGGFAAADSLRRAAGAAGPLRDLTREPSRGP